MASSSSLSILRSSAQLNDPIHVTGMTRGAQALFIARWAKESPEPIVVIVPDADLAMELREEIETLSESVFGSSVKVKTLPAWEQSPYSPISPSLKTRLGRIAALSDAYSDRPSQVILTTLDSGLLRTIDPKTFAEHSFTLKEGASVGSRDEFALKLAHAGYLRVDPVEDPGTFAVRGDIIDVFPPHFSQPVRIELFGDEVEKIRFFDASTQRAATSEAGASSVQFGPARETLILPDTLSRVRELVKTRADDLGVPRSVRDPIMESIYPGSAPDHSEFWAPFCYSSPKSFFESFRIERLLVIDQLSCEQNWDAWLAEEKEREGKLAAEGLVLPRVDELYSLGLRPFESTSIRKQIFLDRIELAQLDAPDLADAEDGSSNDPKEEKVSAHHRTFVRGNGDLNPAKKASIQDLEPKLKLWLRQGFKTLVFASTQSQIDRIKFLFQERNLLCSDSKTELAPSIITFREGHIEEGFRWPSEGLVVVTESEILGTKSNRKKRRGSAESGSAAKDWSNLQALTDLSVGDGIVHIDHGIGRYQGLVRLDLSGAPADFLLLEYANKDKLYLPVYRLNVIQKYMGGSGESVPLDRLGSQQFAKEKEKVREAVKKIAFDLVQLYAERKIRPGLKIHPRDSAFREFEAKFPFDETPDQLKAVDASLDDMESGRVMDRLICGDVGYGKTEVAMRAAFKIISEGHQVAVLVPTTVLAHQHEQSFRARMKDYPVRIESVSRFKSAKNQKDILKEVGTGKVDIIIGTHRLLSKDVNFKNLGLVIIDEEHRFGVEHKEKLKTLRINTHVMTLTATPIPRTLHMALSGMRDISLINTAPVNRLPIRTYISKFDEDLIRRAIETELSRGGQVFFVHNRVQSIYEIASRIRELVPIAQVTVGHGQMSEGELEVVMMDFYQKKANILVATTIIESGIDVPTANTMIINRADMFGLAQLYQLRGRVGRSQTRAYAYLMLPAEGAISEDAKKRLEVIQKFVELGSGFSVAAHDLEIRGGGDILGAAQSGHIAAVGFDLYTELLEEAIREIQGKPLSAEDSHREPEIKVPFSAFLSEIYVPDVHQRLGLYRRLSGSNQEQEIDEIEMELQDRYGALPEEAKNLLWLIRVKQLLKLLRVDALTVGPERVVLTPGANSLLDPIRAISLMASQSAKYQLTPDSKFIAKVKILSLKELYFTVQTLLKEMQFRVDPSPVPR